MTNLFIMHRRDLHVLQEYIDLGTPRTTLDLCSSIISDPFTKPTLDLLPKLILCAKPNLTKSQQLWLF